MVVELRFKLQIPAKWVRKVEDFRRREKTKGIIRREISSLGKKLTVSFHLGGGRVGFFLGGKIQTHGVAKVGGKPTHGFLHDADGGIGVLPGRIAEKHDVIV